MTNIDIAGRAVGCGAPVFFIAEMSANHNLDLERALDILRAARDAGADAVKLQTYTADTMTIDCDNPYFRVGEGSLWSGEKLHSLYQRAHTPWDWHQRLQAEASALGLVLFSTPFDETAVDFLESLGMPAYKVASFELTDLPLIQRIARTGKPLIMSTGMGSREEIQEAIDTARTAGARDIILLKCTSAYPAPPASMHLRSIPALAATFGVLAGLSDHTLGIEVPIAAVALGACAIEKHFTLSRAEPGPDSAFSLEPAEFAAMVRAVRNIEAALGSARFGPTDIEKKSLQFRRSLFVVQQVAKGERFTRDNVRVIRPGHGLPPKHYEQVLGHVATRDLPIGTPLSWDDVEA